MADPLSEFPRAIAVIPSTHSRAGLLALSSEVPKETNSSLKRHPTTLFQCLWNDGWWTDCPELGHKPFSLSSWPE